MSKVVVTGIGAVSACGLGAEALWQGMSGPIPDPLPHGPGPAGPSGGRSSTDFEPPGGRPVTDFDASAVLGPKGLRLLDRATCLALVGAHLALEDAGLGERAPQWPDMRPPGLVVGTSFGSLASIGAYIETRIAHGPAGLNPGLFPNTVINSPASQAAIRFGLSTLCSTISLGWASGAESIGYAADALRRNRADIVLAGGVEELTRYTLFAYHHLGLAPATSFGEGVGFLVLEREGAARRRGARLLAAIAGRGTGFNATRGPAGLRRAVAEAMANAGLDGSSWPVDLLVSGGCGVPALDDAEAGVFATYQGPRLRPKERLGEADGASGALAGAIAAMACARGSAPGYDTAIRRVLVSAPTFTGHAAALVFERIAP